MKLAIDEKELIEEQLMIRILNKYRSSSISLNGEPLFRLQDVLSIMDEYGKKKSDLLHQRILTKIRQYTGNIKKSETVIISLLNILELLIRKIDE